MQVISEIVNSTLEKALEKIDSAVSEVVMTEQNDSSVTTLIQKPFRILHKIGTNIISGKNEELNNSELTSSIDELENGLINKTNSVDSNSKQPNKSSKKIQIIKTKKPTNALDSSDLGVDFDLVYNPQNTNANVVIVSDDNSDCKEGDLLCFLKKRTKTNKKIQLNLNGCKEGDYSCDLRVNIKKITKPAI